MWLIMQLIILCGLLYGLLVLWIWHKQDRLLFTPDPFARVGQVFRSALGAANNARQVREWFYKTDDGLKIQGFCSIPKKKVQRVVIYFGGIREECSWFLTAYPYFEDALMICMNYRGYGFSEGKANQNYILSDCFGALKQLQKEYPEAFENVYLIGRSLGSGVAGYLASWFAAKKVVLITPYDSILSVAKRSYWWVPVRYILKSPFEAIVWARKNSMQLLMLLSEVDKTVPHEHSMRLFEAWSGPKQYQVVLQSDHSSIVDKADLFKKIQTFFESA